MAQPGELTIEVSVEGLQDVTQKMRQLRTEVEGTATSIQRTGQSMAGTRQAFSLLTQSVSSASRVLNLLGVETGGVDRVLITITSTLGTASVAMQSFQATVVALQRSFVALAVAAAPVIAALTVIAALQVGLGREAEQRERLNRARQMGLITQDLYNRALRGEADALMFVEGVLRRHEDAFKRTRAEQERSATWLQAVQGPLSVVAERTRAVGSAARESVDDIVAYNVALRAWFETLATARREAFMRLPEVITPLTAEMKFLIDAINRIPTTVFRGGQPFADVLPPAIQTWLQLGQEFSNIMGIAQQLAQVNRQVAIQFVQDWLEAARVMGKVITPEMEAAFAALKALPTAVLGAWDQVQAGIGERMKALQNQLAVTFKELAGPVLDLLMRIRDSMATMFSDVLTGAKNFGDALRDFFGNVVNDILRMLSRIAATWLVNLIFGVKLPFAQGGIIPGHLVPIFAAAEGGVFRRPTLAMIAEGGEEAAVPLRGGRIPVELLGGGPGREIAVTVNVVFDPEQIPRPNADEIVSTIVLDMRSGGPTARTVRSLVR